MRRSGRPAVFCRFAGCNLWSGLERDRDGAVCQFCDTDFVGTDGPDGGVFETAEAVGGGSPSDGRKLSQRPRARGPLSSAPAASRCCSLTSRRLRRCMLAALKWRWKPTGRGQFPRHRLALRQSQGRGGTGGSLRRRAETRSIRSRGRSRNSLRSSISGTSSCSRWMGRRLQRILAWPSPTA